MTKVRTFADLPITTRFILWFLLITLIPLAISTYVSYDKSRKILTEEATKRLFTIADNKTNQIEAYFREKEENVSQLARMPTVTSATKSFKEAIGAGGIISPAYKAVDREFRPFFAYYRELFGYDNLLLVSSDGRVVFSVGDKKYGTSLYEMALIGYSELANIFLKVSEKGSLKTNISNFEYDPESHKPSLFIIAPILSEKDSNDAIVAEMNNDGISELVQDYGALGKTGETIIVAKIDKKAALITPLRFASGAGPEKKIMAALEKELPVQQLLDGKSGSGISLDYRGKEVLVIWKYLPALRIGMIVKMDTSEIFTSARQLRNTLLMTNLALLAVVFVMAILIARSISSPIKELTRISSIITGGNLSERAKIDTEDEIGTLAHSFNKMTDSLVEAKANVERERRRLEEQKKLLEKANQELDGFVYTASHDLRAPLRAISSFSNFLEEDYKKDLDKKGKDYLSEIRKGAERMDKLINDLLTLSQISRIENPYESVEMSELVKSAVERIKFDIEKHKVDLKIQADMPTILCDPIKIGEVFLNLINNAVKFSSRNKKEKPKVEVGYADKGDFHEFYVKDNGIGIDPKHHQDIFRMFKRLEAAREFDGTGAGLSIVKRVVEDCGGRIWVESKPGDGAAFYFTIPKSLRKKTYKKVLTIDGFISKDEQDRGA